MLLRTGGLTVVAFGRVPQMVTPIIKHNIVKKRTALFNRHHSDRFKRLDVRRMCSPPVALHGPWTHGWLVLPLRATAVMA